MRFKQFILNESISKTEIRNIKELITTFSNKETTSEQKRDSGVVFFVSNLGSWPIFSSKFIEKLKQNRWKVEEIDNENFTSTKDGIKFWTKFEKNNVYFFVAKKDVEEPEWEESEEETVEDTK